MRTAKILTFVLALTTVFTLQAEAFTRKFRLYNVQTAEKIDAAFRFKWSSLSGRVVATLPSGEKLEGEFNTGNTGAVTWGNIYASNGTLANGSAVTLTSGQGSLILTGKNGFDLQCEYVTNVATTHGNGACVDNQGGRYRLLF